ncbi:MAG: WD40 repeat domain-containing protein [Deltaproteobacteria bacterium]|nr:WD40 repeat domain-containing protein [Deltaproteobacteria bacterium]
MIRSLTPPFFFVFATLLVVALLAPPVNAVSTFHFLLDDAKEFAEGEFKGAAVNSDGSITAGVHTDRVELKSVPIARCLLRAADGSVLIGTGNKGEVYKLKGDTLSLFARTGELMVTSLVRDKAGTLYAGTLPSGKIFTIDKQGKASEFAKPKGAEHVWSLVFDAKRELIFAATGPEGKVFAVDRKGKAELFYDADADHVMTLALDDDGSLYAGTSDEALLVRIRAPNRAEVVYDFPGNEVTAMAINKGAIAVAVNEFPKPTFTAKKETKVNLNVKPNDSVSSTTNSNTAGSVPTPAQRSQPGKGQLWRVAVQGEAEQLFDLDKGHLTKVQWAGDDIIYAAAGHDGRIYRVKTDGTHAVWIDVDERQVLDMDLISDRPLFVTGDSAAVYRIVSASDKKSVWISKPLDAKVLSRFGELEWRAQGKIQFQTRSGNTRKPDSSWTHWSSPLAEPGPIRSPQARFLQIRASLNADPKTMLYAVKAFYLPQNQRAIVKEIAVEPELSKNSSSKDKSGTEKSELSSFSVKPTSVYKISWKVHNPDGDRLRYRLKYRAENQKQWREMLRESEVLTDRKHEWETSGIPDGYYRIQVSASDELDNPKRTTLQYGVESEPVLIDNHPPRIEALRLVGNLFQGKARDDMGPISRLEYAIDGRDWIMIFPSDDLLDTAEESFSLKLDDLEPGPHIIAVRAFDAAGNATSSEVTIP